MFFHNTEETATTDTASNNDYGDCDAGSLIHNKPKVQISLPPLCLPIGMPYMWAPSSTIASTVPVATMVGGQTSKLEMSHDRQDINTIKVKNDHKLPRERIIVQNTDSFDDDEYIASAGDDSHESTLEDRESTSADDELDDPHIENIWLYLLRDAQNFDIDEIYKEENEGLGCDRDIYRD